MLQNLNHWMLKMYVEKSQDLKDVFNRLKGNERGAVAVEYGLIIAVVVAMVIAAALLMKDPLIKFFDAAVNQISAFMSSNAQ